MDIIDAMDVQSWFALINNCIVGKFMFKKPRKAHRHILFIFQNIERRDWINIYFGPPKGFEVRWGYLSIFRGKNLGCCYSSIVLKTGPTFRWIYQLNMPVSEVLRSKKIGSAYVYIYSICVSGWLL